MENKKQAIEEHQIIDRKVGGRSSNILDPSNLIRLSNGGGRRSAINKSGRRAGKISGRLTPAYSLAGGTHAYLVEQIHDEHALGQEMLHLNGARGEESFIKVTVLLGERKVSI